MMRRSPLHIARVSADDPPEIEVLDSYEIAYGFVEVAIELWRLAGRSDRATAIDDVITSAWETELPRLQHAQLIALRGLLEGLEGALVGTLTDAQHLLSAEMVEQLRGRTETLDLSDTFGGYRRDPRGAVQEALIYVDHLRAIVTRALEAGACILFD